MKRKRRFSPSADIVPLHPARKTRYGLRTTNRAQALDGVKCVGYVPLNTCAYNGEFLLELHGLTIDAHGLRILIEAPL